MKKNDLIFAALLAAVFCVLAAILGLMLPTEVTISGSFDADLPVSSGTQTPAPQTTLPAVTTPVVTQPADTGSDDVTTPPAEEVPADTGIPQGNEAILAKYTELMNDAKAQSVGFKKIEWQAIPEEKAQFEGKVLGKILPIASNFFKSEADAKANPEHKPKDDGATWLPIYHNSKGCMLTDVNAIENATCTELPDGNVKIVIELKNELNSEPPVDAPTCDSTIGSMFTPIQFAEVRNTLETDPTVKFIVKNVEFDLEYFDCIAELTYNPETNQIVTLDQFMHININIKNGSILGLSAKGTAVLDNYMYVSDFEY